MKKIVIVLVIVLLFIALAEKKTRPLRKKFSRTFNILDNVLGVSTETIENFNLNDYDEYQLKENEEELNDSMEELLEMWSIDRG